MHAGDIRAVIPKTLDFSLLSEFSIGTVGRFLFTPLALAVVFAMITSYLLSRTLVTAMAAICCPKTTKKATATDYGAAFSTASSAGSSDCVPAIAPR